jgi:hypothetical protein
MVFELAREENPRLYDELAQFSKGSRRVNRLRVLAYDGLLAQNGVFSQGPLRGVAVPPNQTVDAATTLTNAVFQPGLAE